MISLFLQQQEMPIVSLLEGKDLKNILILQIVEDAESVKIILAEEKAKDVVIAGGGLIGVEILDDGVLAWSMKKRA